MKIEQKQELLRRMGGGTIDKIDHIQELWSGYGSILRIGLAGSNYQSVILKHIVIPNATHHPRGWNTATSNARKIRSYAVETNWYTDFSERCDSYCRIPKAIDFWGDERERFIVLEDLDSSGYPDRKSYLRLHQIEGCIGWLANFHATFLRTDPLNLWERGSYWHLATRTDEYHQMEEGELKNAAQLIDQRLSSCRFKTIIHGDAKLANFCFGSDPLKVAAVDFQYVGGGCGIQDLAYFLGSCLDEDECEQHEEAILNMYFGFLKNALDLRGIQVDFSSLELEWRALYPVAWADFTRFLLGWMPTHRKLNEYTEKMVRVALSSI
jgi:hypothetical protein